MALTSPDEAPGRVASGDRRDDVRSDVVFVVHGRDVACRDAMFDLLGAFRLRPLEWSDALARTKEPNPFISDVLDAAFRAAVAILVLFTPDDLAILKPEFLQTADPEYERTQVGQARANVLFEAGMAMGRSPARTILVEVGHLRPFSNIAGRHVLRFDGSFQTRLELARRLAAAGCPVDTEGTHWHTTGVFPLPAADLGETAPIGPEVSAQVAAADQLSLNVHLRPSATPGRGHLILQNDGPLSVAHIIATFLDPHDVIFFDDPLPVDYLVPGQRVTWPVVSLSDKFQTASIQLTGRVASDGKDSEFTKIVLATWAFAS